MSDRTLYFIGNVLPDAASADRHPESHIKSFHIDQDESRKMDLTGLPIRLEHHDALAVGTIKKQFTDNSGKKWVDGEINNDSVQSSFVGKDLMSKNAIFTGLSLQHVYREFSDGSSTKTPVEVSLCREPRRGGCNVAVVRATLTEKQNYKPTNCTPVVQMASNNTTIQQETSPAAPASDNQAPQQEPVDPDKAQLMQEVLNSVEKQDALAKQLKETQDKRLLSATADAGLLTQLTELGFGLSDIEKILPVLEQNGLVSFAGKNLGFLLNIIGYLVVRTTAHPQDCLRS